MTPTSDNLILYVLGHKNEELNKVSDRPYIKKVLLTELSEDNSLAESRIYINSDILLKNNTKYVGLCTNNWNIKYDGRTNWYGRVWDSCLPLEELNTLEFAPNVVWCGAITDNVFWSEELNNIFNGIHPLVNEIIKKFHLSYHYRLGPLANNFIAHYEVIKDLTLFMRKCHDYLIKKYKGYNWGISSDKDKIFTNRLPAFLMEACSILYFANRRDLILKKIPPRKNIETQKLSMVEIPLSLIDPLPPMDISQSDVNLVYSGGVSNTDPNQSLGGKSSLYPVLDGVDNLFDDISADNALIGQTDYRCFYVYNDNSDFSLYNVSVWLDVSKTVANIAIAIGSPDQVSPFIGISNNPPNNIDFSYANSSNDSLNIDVVLPLQGFYVWVKRTIPPGTINTTNDGFIFNMSGNDANG